MHLSSKPRAGVKRTECRVRAAVVALCFSLLWPTAASTDVFQPSNSKELSDAFVQAGSNLQHDIIDLDGQAIELSNPLVLEPDEGFGLVLRNGALIGPVDSPGFRLLHLLAVPFFIEDAGHPVLIEGVQFKNGFVAGNEVAGDTDGGGALRADRNTIINNTRFVNNRVAGNASGGAIKHSQSLELAKVLFANNRSNGSTESQPGQGGAIAIDPGGSLVIAHGYFLGNHADEGGAIYASHNVSGLTITRSAFDGNTARLHGGAIWSNVGDGDVRVSNTSFVANQAPLGGGAIYTRSLFAKVSFVHVTMWGNESSANAGGAILAMLPRNGSNIVLQNSVLANNVGGNCISTENEYLSFAESSYNLVDDETCGLQGVDTLTGVASLFSGKFDYHGGFVPSLPIAKTGQASNLVPREQCLGYDVRDLARLDNSPMRDEFCDAGAFEFLEQQYIDFDGDGVRNREDNCRSLSNPLQSDIDGDNIGDECDKRDDRDSDNDVVLNFQDNCPAVVNFIQLDVNANGIGDACEQTDTQLSIGPVY